MSETKARHIANLVEDDGDVKSAHLDNITVTPTAVSDQANTSTGYIDLPSGTTAQRPASPNAGNLRFNTDAESLEVHSGSAWIAASEPTPTITSISGTIYAGISGRSLTITGTQFNATNISIQWLDGSTQITRENNITPTSATSVTRTIPASVYGKASGTTIGIRVLNAGSVASNTDTSKSVIGVPTGGALDSTSVSGYRIHTFTASTTNFINYINNLSIEYLVIAGGGAGGSAGGGGGAGGYKTNVPGQPSGANSSTLGAFTLPGTSSGTTYTITVGAGGSVNSGNPGGQGGLSSISGSGITDITTVGGGGGGSYLGSLSPTNGGSAGGQASGNGSAASATANQGTTGSGGSGGTGVTTGGGGGGAGSAGSTGTSSAGGSGGGGLNNNITGTSVTRGGGGAGGGDNRNPGTAGGTGGSGGGGQGNQTANSGQGDQGEDGKGAGGGGGSISSGGDHDVSGGDGGDGIVIIRYQLP